MYTWLSVWSSRNNQEGDSVSKGVGLGQLALVTSVCVVSKEAELLVSCSCSADILQREREPFFPTEDTFNSFKLERVEFTILAIDFADQSWRGQASKSHV